MNLYQAFSKIKNEKEFNAFVSDLLTVSEIREINARWRIAQLLWNVAKEKAVGRPDAANPKYMKKSRQGMNYKDIAGMHNAGTATVSRVAKCLFENKDGGYRNILKNNKG